MSQTNEKVYDLLISGAGIPGASLALGAAHMGYRVALIDPRDRFVKPGDTRTTAFLPESLHFLDRLALLDPVRDQAQELRQMRLMNDQGELRDQPQSLTFEGVQGCPLALNIPNQALAQVIADEVAKIGERIDCLWNTRIITAIKSMAGQALVTLDSGQSLCASMAIAADGRTSTLRNLLGIKWHSASTHQTALTARLYHTQPHEGLSTEFHRHAGPMTFVPLRGDRHETALVWCLNNAVADQVGALDETALLKRIQIASRGVLGNIKSLHSRGCFPVRPGMASAIYKGPFALMAEAAHALPPLLAQGLNLSLKDAEVLLTNLKDLGPGEKAAQAYATTQWADVATRLSVCEGLNQLLYRPPAPLSAAYRLGHQGFQSLPFIRQLAVRLGQRYQQKLP